VPTLFWHIPVYLTQARGQWHVFPREQRVQEQGGELQWWDHCRWLIWDSCSMWCGRRGVERIRWHSWGSRLVCHRAESPRRHARSRRATLSAGEACAASNPSAYWSDTPGHITLHYLHYITLLTLHYTPGHITVAQLTLHYTLYITFLTRKGGRHSTN